VDLVPAEATSDGILLALKERGVRGETIGILSHGADSSRLKVGLEEMGAEVITFSAYSYSLETDSSGAQILDSMKFNAVMPTRSRVLELIEEILEGRIAAITFTSPPAARNLFAIASDNGMIDQLRNAMNSKTIVVAVGPPTRAAIEEGGVRVDVVSPIYKMGPMVKAMSDHIASVGLKGGGASGGRVRLESGPKIADRP
jgi:uroporphyrinogen-III synthase